MFVKELEITLENGMKISGELDLPERQGQWKTIILFHGSGPSDRHATVESMGGIVSRNFDLLSEGFVKARYAVFRYDKRENYDIEIIIRDAREVQECIWLPTSNYLNLILIRKVILENSLKEVIW